MMTDCTGVMAEGVMTMGGITRRVKHLLRGCMVLVIAMVLVACAGQAPVPEDRYYRLPDVASVQAVVHPLAGSVGVARLQSDGLRNERAILYINAELPLEINRYHYHHWVDAPTRMIQEHMLSFLRSATVAKSVVRVEPGVDAEYVVGGRLLRFERILGTDNGKVLVEMELAVHHNHTPYLAQKIYHAEVRPHGAALHEVAEAFGAALQQIYLQLVGDLPAIPPESRR